MTATSLVLPVQKKDVQKLWQESWKAILQDPEGVKSRHHMVLTQMYLLSVRIKKTL